ncbi:MAG: amidohydrolase family protein [Thermoanaerobaculia bacterium]
MRGDRILRVGPDAEVEAPEGAEILEADGRTLLPGLTDLHTHLGEDDGLLNLAGGVTAVRDLGNDIDAVTALASSWESGRTLGPRVTLAGIIDGPGPYAGPTKMLVATEDEARAAIDAYAERGFVQIKLYSSLDRELVPFMIDYAHSKGLRVSGHVPAFMTAAEVVRDGYDEIQHANFLVLNFLFDDVQDTRTPARFTAVAEHGGELDPGAPEVSAFFDLLTAHETVLDPTVGIFEMLLTARPGVVSPGFAPVADRLPVLVRRGALGGGLAVPDGQDALYHRSFQTLEDFVYEAWRRGIRIVAGTDGLAGFMLHRELELYVEAGIPPAEVLALDTLGAARVLGRESDLGEIHPGKLADMILVDGEPDRRISDVRNVVTVIRGGAVLDVAAMDRALGITPRQAVD